MKFDCVKVSGRVDAVRNVISVGNYYKGTIVVDGESIPNVQITNKFYEELNAGENVTLYGVFKNLKQKDKNSGVLYGLQKENGEKMFATHFRLMGPMMLLLYAFLAFCLVFVVGWVASCVPVIWIWGKDDVDGLVYHATVFAIVEACLAAGFYLWRAWTLIKITDDPDSWDVMSSATLSSRFSKFHK
jgi:hypothetical protein